ncbi:MAG: hypothetical protein WC647_13215 [Desulfomonilaceae bacterium]
MVQDFEPRTRGRQLVLFEFDGEKWRARPALRKNTPMSSRASAATRDLTKALDGTALGVSAYKPPGWISPKGRNDIGGEP